MSRSPLIVEQKAKELLAEVTRLLKKAGPPCNATQHLESAADSVYFNLGEGAAAFRPKKKAAKYDIARGEAKEVQRALEALVIKGRLTAADIALAYSLADEIIAMLTTMMKNLEGKPNPSPPPSPSPVTPPSTVPP